MCPFGRVLFDNGAISGSTLKGRTTEFDAMVYINVVRGSCPPARRTTSAGEPGLGRRVSLVRDSPLPRRERAG
jgi:hypothetical protein